MVERLSLAASSQLLEKSTLDLLLLTLWPECLLKLSKVLRMEWQFLISALAKRVRPSAKNKWESFSPHLLVDMGVQLGCPLHN